MASAAVGAELPVVDIVARVAIAATAAQCGLYSERLPVAGIAGNRAVRTVKAECGLRVVVEAPLRPVDRCMAGSAVIGKTIAVWVVPPVAGVAVLGRVAEDL